MPKLCVKLYRKSMNRLLLAIITMLCMLPAHIGMRASTQQSAKGQHELYDEWRSLYTTRQKYMNSHQAILDSMSMALRQQTVDSVIADNAYLLGCAYLRVNIDSAYKFFDQADHVSREIGLVQLNTLSRAQKIAIKPYKNILSEAVIEFQRIDPNVFTNRNARIEFFRCAHRLYNLVEDVTPLDTLRSKCARLRDAAIDSVIHNTPRDTAVHNMMYGFKFFNEERYKLSIASFMMALDSCTTTMPERSRLLLALSVANEMDGSHNEAMRYALEAACNQIKNGDRLGGAWIQLDNLFQQEDKIIEAYDALEVAMENATNSDNLMATVMASRHYYDINTTFARYYLNRKDLIFRLICVILALVLIDSIVLISGRLRRRKKDKVNSELPAATASAVENADISELTDRYKGSISDLINLFAVYMDKIEDFQRMARRRINSGQTTELLSYLQSGKVVNEQSELFTEIFDTAFLSVYPDFVEEINSLLRPDKQIVTESPLRLTNEVRIFAFMRLGIDDTTRISRFLNVSVNTIYTYRNRMRQRAINRDTFEADLTRTGTNGKTADTATDDPADENLPHS